MGSKKPFQRKQSKINKKNTRKTKNRLNISFHGVHELVSKNWDKKKTLKENYKSLGLLSHLNGYAGGQLIDQLQSSPATDGLIDGTALGNMIGGAEIADLEKLDMSKVEWKSIEQLDKEKKEKKARVRLEKETNPLITLLAPLEPEVKLDDHIVQIGEKVSLKKSIEPASFATDSLAFKVIHQMRQEAQNGRKTYRFQSEQETLVFETLMEKYGLDFEKMARDRKLNTFQLSEGQLRKKFSRCLQSIPIPADEI